MMNSENTQAVRSRTRWRHRCVVAIGPPRAAIASMPKLLVSTPK